MLFIEEGILETKTDCSAKDLLVLACVAFCVITFEPIMIQTNCSAPQNDHLKFCERYRVVVEKMTRNCRKMIKKMKDSFYVLFIAFSFRL